MLGSRAKLRLVGAFAAVACAAAMIVPAVAAPAVAAPAAAAIGRAQPALLPAHVFAPYYFNTSDTLAATSRASGAKYLTLAFLQTPRHGSCTVDWNGGRSWSAPVAVDPDGGGLTAVSCPAGASCVAVDFDGRAVALPG
jgi:hypothetical protein